MHTTPESRHFSPCMMVFFALLGCHQYRNAAQTSDTTVADETAPTSDMATDTPPPDMGMVPECENGVIDDGEACDLADEDTRPCKPDCSALYCGDGITQEDEDIREECDDRNLSDYDKCSSTCTLTFCGDGITQRLNGKERPEECDYGIPNNRCTEECKLTKCGDGKTQAPNASGMMEDCDLGEAGNDGKTTCNADCTFTYCGDGTPQEINGDGGSEQCDDGQKGSQTCTDKCELTYCGDGQIQEVNGEGGAEECDDGNDDDSDGCKSDCTISYVVFLSSATFQGSLGGLKGADTLCQDLADGAKIPGKFRAWLSDATIGPTGRFENKDTTAPFQLRGGTSVAASWDDLTKGPLSAAVSTDENGASPGDPKQVWTHTGTDGAPINTTGHCDSWESSVGYGDYGVSSELGGNWTNDDSSTCDKMRRLYCFQTSLPTQP